MGLGKTLLKAARHLISKYVTKISQKGKFSRIRDKNTPVSRDIEKGQIAISEPIRQTETAAEQAEPAAMKTITHCPYCEGKSIVKKGHRKKKLETIQLYLCQNCKRVFTPQTIKGKTFPLKMILDGLSFYNTGFTLGESCQFLKEQYGFEVTDATLSNWVKEFESLCRYSRLRPYGLKLFSPHQVIQTVHLFHRQVYDFSVHRAKLALLLQEYRNNKFDNLREFLEAIQQECPHQFFQDGERSSELKVDFDLAEVMVREKQNFANRLAALALQAVNDNKERHKALQRFFLCNDSVTVAVEVPVYMDELDIEHMQEELGFRIPIPFAGIASRPFGLDNAAVGDDAEGKSTKQPRQGQCSTPGQRRQGLGTITGHIDILQLRNGAVHILDYKPDAGKAKKASSISQLTLYALALSRLTGFRLYDFKCAWFDENSYFEFFPLHVVYKLRSKARKDDPTQIKFSELGEGFNPVTDETNILQTNL